MSANDVPIRPSAPTHRRAGRSRNCTRRRKTHERIPAPLLTHLAVPSALSATASCPDCRIPAWTSCPAQPHWSITDPQNDFLSPDGVTWGVVGKNVDGQQHRREHRRTVRRGQGRRHAGVHLAALLLPARPRLAVRGCARGADAPIGMFDRKDALSLEGFEGSGADWLAQYKKYIDDGETVVTSPHKVYGPETNDLVLQLRKRGIDKVILAGMSANLCTESHMRELIEQGFEVAGRHRRDGGRPAARWDGYAAASPTFA